MRKIFVLAAIVVVVAWFSLERKNRDEAIAQGKAAIDQAQELGQGAWDRANGQQSQAAKEVQDLKSEMDNRVKAAMKLKENAEKSAKDVQDSLAKADQEYQELQKKLHAAQSAYDNASHKLQEISKKLQSLTN